MSGNYEINRQTRRNEIERKNTIHADKKTDTSKNV